MTTTVFDPNAPHVTVAELVAALLRLDQSAAVAVILGPDSEECTVTSVTFEYPGYAAINCDNGSAR